jgi:hypothetical protein
MRRDNGGQGSPMDLLFNAMRASFNWICAAKHRCCLPYTINPITPHIGHLPGLMKHEKNVSLIEGSSRFPTFPISEQSAVCRPLHLIDEKTYQFTVSVKDDNYDACETANIKISGRQNLAKCMGLNVLWRLYS